MIINISISKTGAYQHTEAEASGVLDSALKPSLKGDVARCIRGCLPCFVTCVFVSDVDLAPVRHFFYTMRRGCFANISCWTVTQAEGKLEGGERTKHRPLVA